MMEITMENERFAAKKSMLIAAMCGAAMLLSAPQAAAETCKETNVASPQFGETFECTPFVSDLGKGADGRVGTIVPDAAGTGGDATDVTEPAEPTEPVEQDAPAGDDEDGDGGVTPAAADLRLVCKATDLYDAREGRKVGGKDSFLRPDEQVRVSGECGNDWCQLADPQGWVWGPHLCAPTN